MEDPAKRSPVWQLPVAIMFVALALRLIFIHFLYRDTWNNFENHLLFGFETGRIARSIALGHGFANPMSVNTGPTAWMTPIYPYLLAAVFKVFGTYTRASAFVILGLNGIFSSLICLPLYFAARRTFGRRVAIVACWLWAIFPYSIYISSSFVWETCLSALLLALLFLWTLILKDQRVNSWSWLGFGALWGVGALTNTSMLSVAPFLTLWAIYPLWEDRKKWLSAGLLVALGLGIVILPWQVRNYRTFHAPIPMRDTFWLVVWMGNDGNTGSQADMSVHPSISKSALDEYVRLGEISYMQEKRREALGFISRHPRFFLEMSLRKFAYLWTGYWNAAPANLRIELYDPANIFLTVPITLLMCLGIWRAFRTARDALLPYLLMLGIYPLIFYFTDPELRYRHLIDPQILTLAALGVIALAEELVRGTPALEAWFRRLE